MAAFEQGVFPHWLDEHDGAARMLDLRFRSCTTATAALRAVLADTAAMAAPAPTAVAAPLLRYVHGACTALHVITGRAGRLRAAVCAALDEAGVEWETNPCNAGRVIISTNALQAWCARWRSKAELDA